MFSVLCAKWAEEKKYEIIDIVLQVYQHALQNSNHYGYLTQHLDKHVSNFNLLRYT